MSSEHEAHEHALWNAVVAREPLTAASHSTLSGVVARLVARPDCSCVLAVYRRKVVGLATRQHVLQAVAQDPNWSRLRLSSVVRRQVPVATRSQVMAIAPVLDLFERHQLAQLPVVDAKAHLIGLIEHSCLLQFLHEHGAAAQLSRQHQRTQLFAEITLKIRQSLQLQDILQTTVNEVQRLLQADRALIYQVLPDGTGTAISESVVAPYPAILGMSFPEEVFPEEYQTLYAKGRVQAIADVHAPDSGLADCLVDFIEQWDIRSKLIVPIVHPLKPSLSVGKAPLRRHLWGLLIVHQCGHPRQWSGFEVDLMQQLADQISIALSHGQLLEYLEERVKLRTAELTQANRSLQQEIQERKQIEAALRQSESQLRLITNNLPVLIAYVDNQQRYRFNNQVYEHWLGRSPADIYGQSMAQVMGEGYYQAIQRPVATALAGEQVSYESELTFKDGRTRSVAVTYIPHIERSAESSAAESSTAALSTADEAQSPPVVAGFFALTTDISDRKAIERMKDEFIAVVSHELRTPLTSIHTSLKLLATGRLGELSDNGQQMLEVADENTDRLVRLVNNVLDLQRIEAGEVTMDACACDAGELIEQAAEAMQTLAQQHEITICTQPEALAIWADPDYMVQTLTNLMGNAIKFSAAGKAIQVTVVASSHQMACFSVQDHGQGIPPEHLTTIFERFQQVDSSDSRKKGGTGLGLTICRKIIEQHGGQIWAESQMGIGSCFYFTVPRFPVVSAALRDAAVMAVGTHASSMK